MTQEEKDRLERKKSKEYQFWLKTGQRHPTLDETLTSGKRSRSLKRRTSADQAPVEKKRESSLQSSSRKDSPLGRVPPFENPSKLNGKATSSSGRVSPTDRQKAESSSRPSTSGRVSPYDVNKNVEKRSHSSSRVVPPTSHATSSKHKTNSNSGRVSPSLPSQKDRHKHSSNNSSARSGSSPAIPPKSSSQSNSKHRISGSAPSSSSSSSKSSSSSSNRDQPSTSRTFGNPNKFSFSHSSVDVPSQEVSRPASNGSAEKRKLSSLTVERSAPAPAKKQKLGNPYLDRDKDFSQLSTWDRLYQNKRKDGE